MKTTLAVMVMVSVAASAGAQVVLHERQSKAESEQHLQVLLEKTGTTGVHLTFEAKPVVGAPYAGEAVNETVQTLADGNRIVRRTASRIYRDGKGRTRRETLNSDGQVTSVVITDPAGGRSVVFDPNTNTARQSGVATFISAGGERIENLTTSGGATWVIAEGGKSTGTTATTHETKVITLDAQAKPHITTGQAGVMAVGPGTWVSAESAHPSRSPASKEDLGEQIIEGVTAKGTRTTTVIAAGEIGNEQPITITSEEWLSTELKVLVMTKHVDPRAGETTYRLTGITRNEPDPSLFELPAGITVK